jgi:hypothetical protein
MNESDLIRDLSKSLRVMAVNYHLASHDGIDWSVCDDRICRSATRSLYASSLYSDLNMFRKSDAAIAAELAAELDSSGFMSEVEDSPHEENPCL